MGGGRAFLAANRKEVLPAEASRDLCRRRKEGLIHRHTATNDEVSLACSTTCSRISRIIIGRV